LQNKGEWRVKYRKYEKKSIAMKSYSVGFAVSHKGSLVFFWRGPKSASATMSREIWLTGCIGPVGRISKATRAFLSYENCEQSDPLWSIIFIYGY